MSNQLASYQASIVSMGPASYIDLPENVKQAYPELALLALSHIDHGVEYPKVWSLEQHTPAFRIYESVPEAVKNHSRRLSEAAVRACSFCYSIVPLHHRENNWDLIDDIIDITCQNMTLFPCEDIASFIETMPLIMAQCFVRFFLHAKYEITYNANSARYIITHVRNYYFVEDKTPQCLEPPDILPHEVALAWLQSTRPHIGYMMLPVPTQRAYPDLLTVLRRLPVQQYYPAMIPAPLLEHDYDMCLAIVTAFPEAYPELAYRIRLAHAGLVRYLLSHLPLTRLWISAVPAEVWQEHPEWTQELLQHHPHAYLMLPLAIREAYPETAALLLRDEPFHYATNVPESVKEGRWDMATMAIVRHPALYGSIPDTMRNVRPDMPPDNELRALELARLALRTDTTYHYAGPPTQQDYRHHMLQSGPHQISTPGRWNTLSRDMTPTTQRALLTHLYNTGEVAHLRQMGHFEDTRAHALSSRHWAERIMSNHSPRLPKELLDQHILPHQKPPDLKAEHARWAPEHLHALWIMLNSFLFLVRRRFYMHDDNAVYSIQRECDILLPFFCDPHYALSISLNDEPQQDDTLTADQQALAQSVARSLWELQGVMHVVSEAYPLLDMGHMPLRRYFLQHFPQSLQELGFPMPPDLRLPPLATAYLAKPRIQGEHMEPMFCEDYPDATL